MSIINVKADMTISTTWGKLNGFIVHPAGGDHHPPDFNAFPSTSENRPPNTFIRIEIPVTNTQRRNIYFPRNAQQPSSKDAIKYSCANIYNSETSKITAWYMMIFGLDPNNLGGYSNICAIDDKHIIEFSESTTPQQRRIFAKILRKILSTSVGRVLFYRLLIEIRRTDWAHKNLGRDVHNISAIHMITKKNRDKSRSILVTMPDNASTGYSRYAQYGTLPTYDRANVFLEYSNSGYCHKFTKRYSKTDGSKYDEFIHSRAPFDVVVFHELCHWYHHLRNPERFNKECNISNTLNLSNTAIGRYYWQDVLSGNTGEMSISESVWKDRNNHTNFTEIRNILGTDMSIKATTGNNEYDYIEGDDLCENSYRRCMKYPFSFGYSYKAFCEDSRVVDRTKYDISHYTECGFGFDEPVYIYYNDNDAVRVGLGNCRVVK